MASRLSTTQFRSKINQAINKHNQAVRQYNSAVRRMDQNRRNAINSYNQAVNRFNAEQRSRQQQIRNAVANLSQSSQVGSYSVIATSTHSLGNAYLHLEQGATASHLYGQKQFLIDLPQQETTNSIKALYALTGDATIEAPSGIDLGSTVIEEELRRISDDLDARWRGAVFSLSPGNPDASRHFCTSAREIFTQILEVAAPDAVVFETTPSCGVTLEGRPSRRSKIHYLLKRKGFQIDALEEFIEADVSNILELFHVFNDGTHGHAGRFGLASLLAIKKRVEDGILFIAGIAGNTD